MVACFERGTVHGAFKYVVVFHYDCKFAVMETHLGLRYVSRCCHVNPSLDGWKSDLPDR